MLQTLLTTLIVLLATVYAGWRLMPAGWRRGAARLTGTLAHQALPPTVARRIEIRVEAAAQAGGCGDCGPCKACKTGQQPAA